MAKKAHNFHCNACGSACEIYKKGKKHRVLVCPHCGVLATNPFSSEGAALGAALGTIVPGVGNVVGGVVGGLSGYVPDILAKFKRNKTPRGTISTQEGNYTQQKSNRLTAFEKALLLERLECPHGG